MDAKWNQFPSSMQSSLCSEITRLVNQFSHDEFCQMVYGLGIMDVHHQQLPSSSLEAIYRSLQARSLSLSPNELAFISLG
jgi:hypothetical protein